MAQDNNPYFLNTLRRGLEVLALFNHHRNNLNQSEIAAELKVSKTTAFRLATTLVNMGYLTKNPRTKLLSIGPSSIWLSHSLLRSSNQIRVIKPLLYEVWRSLNVGMDATLFDGQKLAVLYRYEIPESMHLHLPSNLPLYCTAVGKAVLGYLPESETNLIIQSTELKRITSKTITNIDELWIDIKKTKKRGYSIANEEFYPGLISIGAPFFYPETDDVMGAISFGVFADRFNPDEVAKKYARTLKKLTSEIALIIPHDR